MTFRLAGSLGPSPCERLKQHTTRNTIVAVLCRCPSSQLVNEPSFLFYYTIGIAILTPLNLKFFSKKTFRGLTTMEFVIKSEPSDLQK